MRILAIETSDTAGSVALADSDRVLAERALEPRQRTAQSLAPAVRELFAAVGWQPADVGLVAVGTGPGSFTGLRIGVTLAKVFAYAAGCQILGVNTLQAVAERAPLDAGLLWAVLDAQRQQLFAAAFERDGQGQLVCRQPTEVLAVEAWLEKLLPGSAVTGPALTKLAARLPAHVRVIDPDRWQPSAAAVGTLAWKSYSAGRRDDVFQLAPQYFRRTAAEEQWEQRKG